MRGDERTGPGAEAGARAIPSRCISRREGSFISATRPGLWQNGWRSHFLSPPSVLPEMLAGIVIRTEYGSAADSSLPISRWSMKRSRSRDGGAHENEVRTVRQHLLLASCQLHSRRKAQAVAFYPPTHFVTMDAWALRKCDPTARGLGGRGGIFCHDGEASPESQLLGCAIQTCPDKVQAASPMKYITDADPPIMILHGDSDQLVPHNQGEELYMAFNKACKVAVFISLPKAPHGNWNGFLTNNALREAATMRSTSSAGCAVVNPTPYTPSWKTVIDFLDRYMKARP
jgi:hypothetical protein